jgi:hypothetical protein
MIGNLSQPEGFSVNDNIPASRTIVKYCSVEDVASHLLCIDPMGETFMAKIDLSEAYRMVPIRKSDWRFLGMRVGDDFFVDRCLPMGVSSGCQIFQRISNAIVCMARDHCPVGCTIYNYLDDFLVLAKGRQDCDRALDHMIGVCQELRVPIAPHKTVRASRSIVFLGCGIDAERQLLFIPPEKATKTLGQLLAFLATPGPRVKVWQQILGKLCHLTQVVTAGRPYLSSVYGSLQGILSQDQHKRRAINAEARSDLGVWVSFLEGLPPSKGFKMLDGRSVDHSFATDASTSVGYGCVFGNKWFAG